MSETTSTEGDQDTTHTLVASLRLLSAFTGMFVRFGLEQLAAFVGICKGLAGAIPFPQNPTRGSPSGRVVRQGRLGGLLNFYSREAA